jgi:hypothetical protein
MGRTMAAVHSIELTRLFAYFGLEARPDVVEAHRKAIRARFDAEVQAIEQLCGELKERERFQVLRAALRLAYERAVMEAAVAEAS